MTEALSKYRGTTTYQLVYHELIAAARYRGVVTYQEVADLMGLPLSGNHMGKEVGAIIGAISEDEHSYGRPMLSAVVVNTSGSPGSGFFALAKDLGHLSDDSDVAKQQFWEREKQAVYAAWQKKLKGAAGH